MLKAKYYIWVEGRLVPAYRRKPRDPRAEGLPVTNAPERKLGIRYYIPARVVYQCLREGGKS